MSDLFHYGNVGTIFRLLGAAFLLALAITLLTLNSRHKTEAPRAVRAFALFLILSAGRQFFLAFRLAARIPGDLEAQAAWLWADTVCLILVLLAGVHFVTVYPCPRTWLGRSRAGPPLLVIMGTAVVVLAAVDPRLLWTAAEGPAAPPDAGLLLLLVLVPMLPILTFVLTRDASKVGAHRRDSLILVAAGLAILDGSRPIHEITHAVVNATGLAPAAPRAGGIFGSLFVASQSLGVLLLLASGLLLWVASRRDASLRGAARAFGALLGFLAVVGVGNGLHDFPTPAIYYAFTVFQSLLYGLIGPLVIAYAFVRHGIFGLDLKIKWTLRKSTLVAIFVAIFFIVSESAAVFLGDQWGTYSGIFAAGGLLFVLAPLQRLVERLADKAMPNVHDTATYREARRRQVYKATLESMLGDGTVTEKDRTVLATLADELGMTSREALDIERGLRAAEAA